MTKDNDNNDDDNNDNDDNDDDHTSAVAHSNDCLLSCSRSYSASWLILFQFL